MWVYTPPTVSRKTRILADFLAEKFSDDTERHRHGLRQLPASATAGLRDAIDVLRLPAWR